jgi:uncharacterized membrane protein
MTSNPDTTQWPAIGRYLEELDAALSGLPAGERQMILGDITDHITSALAEHPAPITSADVDLVLTELGSPQAIVDEGIGAGPATPPVVSQRVSFSSSRGYALMTVLILALGGVVLPFFGWIVGVVFLWISRAWPIPAKIIGTLILPGGVLFILIMSLNPAWITVTGTSCSGPTSGGPETCTTQYSGPPIWLSPTFFTILIALQVASAIYVYRKFRAK